MLSDYPTQQLLTFTPLAAIFHPACITLYVIYIPIAYAQQHVKLETALITVTLILGAVYTVLHMLAAHFSSLHLHPAHVSEHNNYYKNNYVYICTCLAYTSYTAILYITAHT